MNRYSYIDIFRALAILLVTGYHIWRFMGAPEYQFSYYDPMAIFSRGEVGVYLFFSFLDIVWHYQ